VLSGTAPIFIDGKMTEIRLDDGQFRVTVFGSKENGDLHHKMMVLTEKEFLNMKSRIKQDIAKKSENQGEGA
jgi:hypothetical protein